MNLLNCKRIIPAIFVAVILLYPGKMDVFCAEDAFEVITDEDMEIIMELELLEEENIEMFQEIDVLEDEDYGSIEELDILEREVIENEKKD